MIEGTVITPAGNNRITDLLIGYDNNQEGSHRTRYERSCFSHVVTLQPPVWLGYRMNQFVLLTGRIASQFLREVR